MDRNTAVRFIADRISAAILHSGKKKNHIAKTAGIPLSTFMKKLKAEGEFSLGEIMAVADAIGVPAHELMPQSIFKQDSMIQERAA